jgi:CRP-like cAMP-binding protein
MQKSPATEAASPGHDADTRSPIPTAYGRGLLKNPLVKAMGEERVAELFESGELLTFKPGQVIAEQSTPADNVFFIVGGAAKAEILPRDPGGLKVSFGILPQGQDIGLLSVVTCDHHSATVTAVEDVSVISVPTAKIAEVLLKNPELYRIFAEIAVYRLRTSGLWMRSFRSGATSLS